MTRIACDAVFLDAGGVIVLPDRQMVTAALARLRISIDSSSVPRAHYATVRELDRATEPGRRPRGYIATFCAALGVPPERLDEAEAALLRLADRRASNAILWSEPVAGAQRTIAALNRAGIPVAVVTNSDGHAAENLRDAGICQVGAGDGVPVAAIVDSELVESAKPDPGIFRIALERAGGLTETVVHVGDMLCSDVAGARAAGITAIHFDPRRACRAGDHRHLRSLPGIWRHVSAPR